MEPILEFAPNKFMDKVSAKQHRSVPFQHSQFPRHADLVPDIPAFYNLAVAHFARGHSADLQLLTGRSDSQAVARVRHSCCPACEGGVALLYHLLEFNMDIRVGLPQGVVKHFEFRWA